MLHQWNKVDNGVQKDGRPEKLLKSIKLSSPTNQSRARILLPIGNSFVCIGKCSCKQGNYLFVSFERTDKL